MEKFFYGYMVFGAIMVIAVLKGIACVTLQAMDPDEEFSAEDRRNVMVWLLCGIGGTTLTAALHLMSQLNPEFELFFLR